MPVLVLIPGLLCDQRLWSAQITVLAEYADTSVADITEQSTISEMANAVLDHCPEHFALAGLSLGSQVALQIVSTCPRRVQRLALLSATHGGLLPSAEAAIRSAIEVITRKGLDEYLDEAYATYVGSSKLHDKTLKQIFADMAHSVGARAGLRQMQALLALHSPFQNLHQIHCPTLVLGGREDRRTTPEAHRLLSQEIPGSELRIVDDAGHFTTLEQPGIVTDALRHWLKA